MPDDVDTLFRRARYLTSIEQLSKAPPDVGFEVAFSGRSNAGKSSVINTLTGIHHLARTSKTPGRTRLINFFCLDPERRLVDLPGYGYAKVPETVKRRWQRLITQYLDKRQSLRGVVQVMDIRHPLKAFDWQMLAWCQAVGMPVQVLLSKADKLSRGGVARAVLAVVQALEAGHQTGVSVQAFSSLQGTGKEAAQAQIVKWLDGT